MILSKKYKEELDKIIMNEEMKKRILHNVLNENVQVKVTNQSKKKHNVLQRNIGVIAACFTAIICLGVVQNYPEIFTQGTKNLKQQEISKNIDNERNDLQNREGNIPEYSENDNNKNNDNNSNNNNAQKRENTNQASSIDKNSQKSGNENYVDNNLKKSGYSNENSSKVKEKETNSRNSESTSSESAPNAKSESEPDYNTKSRNSKKSNNVKNDSSKSKDEMIEDNGESQDEVMKDESISQDEVTNDESISQDKVTGNRPIALRTNSEEEYKTIEEAESAVNFKINHIKVLPDKFNIDQIDVISNQIIQIEYSDGKDIINFRAGKESDDISGDYNIYEVENNLTINGKSVNLKGHKDGEINLAVWKIDDIAYSISSTNGIKEEKISEMIKSAVMT